MAWLSLRQRLHEGGVRQRRRNHGSDPFRTKGRSGECGETSKGIAYQHSGLLYDLFQKGCQLPRPETVVQADVGMKAWLFGAAKTDQIKSVDPISSL